MTIDMTFEAREKIFRKEEYEEGLAEGKILLLKTQINDGIISLEKAAEYSGLTTEESDKAVQEHSTK